MISRVAASNRRDLPSERAHERNAQTNEPFHSYAISYARFLDASIISAEESLYLIRRPLPLIVLRMLPHQAVDLAAI